MTKDLLLGTALFAALAGIAQSGKISHQRSGVFDFRASKSQWLKTGTHEEKIVSPLKGSGQNSPAALEKTSSPVSQVSWQRLCGSMNVYGMLVNNSQPLQYHPTLNAVTFFHRQSDHYVTAPPLTTAAKSGVVLVQLSQDWGNTWDSTVIWADNSQWGRYPQGAIYNPPSNTNIANAYAVGSGVTVSGSNFTGNWYASKQLNTLDSVISTVSGSQQFYSFSLGTYPPGQAAHGWSRGGFTSTDDGLVRSVGIVESDYQELATVKGFAVATGSFNGSSFDWTVDTLMPDTYLDGAGEKHLSPDPQMAFNQSGTIGYVVGIGAINNSTLANKGYQPIVYKMDRTLGSSATWTLMSGIDFNDPVMRPVVRSKNLSRAGLAGMHIIGTDTVGVPFVNDYDITVDMDGKLHIGAVLMSTATDHPDSLNFISQFTTSINPTEQYKWRHVNGSRPYLYDFIGDGVGPWTYVLVDSASSEGPSAAPGFPGYTENPWDGGDDNIKVGMDTRIQLGRTPNGQFITYSWAESDTAFTNMQLKWNNLPDIKVRMIEVGDPLKYYNVDIGPEQNVSASSNDVKTRSTLHFMSPTSSAANVLPGVPEHTVEVKMPFTVTNSNPYSQTTNNATWYGQGNLAFNMQTYSLVGLKEGPPALLGQAVLYPNPAKGWATISLISEERGSLEITVLNALGQALKSTVKDITAGENKVNVDLSNLSRGIYMVNIRSEKGSATKKLIIE